MKQVFEIVEHRPFPTTAATWKYRACATFLLDAKKVGQWSAAVSVAVGK